MDILSCRVAVPFTRFAPKGAKPAAVEGRAARACSRILFVA